VVDLDAAPDENIRKLAAAKGVSPGGDHRAHPRSPAPTPILIAGVRKAGAAVRLITYGDVAGVIHTPIPPIRGFDIYMASAARPEGVLAAGGRCAASAADAVPPRARTDEKRARAARWGFSDPRKKKYAAVKIFVSRVRKSQGFKTKIATGVKKRKIRDRRAW